MTSSHRLGRGVVVALAAIAIAAGASCSKGEASPPDDGDDSSTAGAGGASAGGTGAGGSPTVFGGTGGSGGHGGGLVLDCGHPDCDGDGYALPADCDDAAPTVNPEAYDFKDDGIDNDCDGTKDDPVESCETSPATAPGTPEDFARAIDVCAQRANTNAGVPFDPLAKYAWGKVSGPDSAQENWTSETKPEIQTAIVSSFGQNAPQHGATMIGLANGPWGAQLPRTTAALDPVGFHLADACADIPLNDLDCATLSAGKPPSGGVSVQDWAELTIWLNVPRNVQGISFDFSFFTTEFNQFWDASLNDAFFVLVGSNELVGENVAKQADGSGISVNSGFFQLCPIAPGPDGLAPDKSAALFNCVGDAGDGQTIFGNLAGTYYDGEKSPPGDQTVLSDDGSQKYLYGGGTGWLRAQFPVTPGEQVQMRFIVLDTYDGVKDSAVLVDNLQWQPVPPPPQVTRPPVH